MNGIATEPTKYPHVGDPSRDAEQIERARVLMRHLHLQTTIARRLGQSVIAMQVDDADDLVSLLHDAVTRADLIMGDNR
ncbi:hypothetical protein [Rubripirellula lacrimiformis]|nr:hypothetical protein [Rubripirellula lacrimiformis]